MTSHSSRDPIPRNRGHSMPSDISPSSSPPSSHRSHPQSSTPLLPLLLQHFSTLQSTGALAHFDLLSRHADSLVSMRSLPDASYERLHLGVVSIPAFQALMGLVNAVRENLPPPTPVEGEKGEETSPEVESAERRTVRGHEEGMDISYVNGFVHTGALDANDSPILHSSASYPPSVNDSQQTVSTASEASPGPPAPTDPTPSASSSPPTSPIVERDRFCKPSRLITAYSSKPFLMTPIHLERQYVTSRKNLDSMSNEEKVDLCTITVRWMGRPAVDELFLVATDVCALINIRKSNTAKTVAQFSDIEKVSMPVHCSSGKGSSTHILTVLTMAGVRRLLTSSRSVLSSALLDYLNRITSHIHAYPHYVPVNDPTKASVVPLVKSAAPVTDPPPAPSPPAPPRPPTPPTAEGQVASVKTEAITPVPAWEGKAVTPPHVLHARSLPPPSPSLLPPPHPPPPRPSLPLSLSLLS